MYTRSRTAWLKHIDFIIGDGIVLFISFMLSYFIRFTAADAAPASAGVYRNILLVMILAQLSSAFFCSNYSGILHRGYMTEFYRVCTHALIATGMVTIFLFASKVAEKYSRMVLIGTFAIYIVIDWTFRAAYKRYLIQHYAKRAEDKNFNRSVMLITDSVRAPEIISDIKSNIFNNLYITGLVLVDQENTNSEIKQIDGVRVICNLANASDYICREWVDEVYIYLGYEPQGLKELYEHCAEMGVTTHRVLFAGHVDPDKQFVERLGEHTVLTTAYTFVSSHEMLAKRVIDIVGGIVGSLLAILIMIIVGPIIYIKSPGPILFKQKRLGRNGKEFYVLKLRSMYLDAEDRKKELMTENRVSDGMMFKIEHDPRIIGNKQLEDGTWKTGIGEFIRKTSLDEFPQFFNVLKGDMSLVGTRPPTLDEWEKYEFHHRARLVIKPGITGMWQVSGRSEITDFEEVVKLDTEYISNYRLSLDIKILFKTVLVLFQRKGAM